MLEQAGASAVTVHGRTRVQLYSGRADWDIIAQVKHAVSIPVFANGDIFTPDDALRALRITSADGLMIGRGAFGDPWLFAEVSAAMEGRPLPAPPTVRERIDMAMRQLTLSVQDKGEHVACLEARKYFPWYLKGIPYSGFFRDRVSHLENMDEAHRLADQMRRELTESNRRGTS